MNKGAKIALGITGGILALSGIGAGIYFLVRKPKGEDNRIGAGVDYKDSEQIKDGKIYKLVEIGSGIRNPKEGETMFALQDCKIEMSNHPETFPKKNYEEYTRSFKTGDEVGVAYWVSSNKIIIDDDYKTRLRKNQHIIKQNANNAGKLGVWRDEDGNPISTTERKKLKNTIVDFLKSDEGKQAVKEIGTAIASKKAGSTEVKAGSLSDGTQVFKLKS